MSNCTTDIAENERENNVETWAADYVKKHEKVDHYLASDFFEMALAGIFNNEISLSTENTDTVYFYSDVYTADYSANNLVTIVDELEERLAPYYKEREILGNNVEIYQFKDKLLILSILKERKMEAIVERSMDCSYTENHPFDGMANCQSQIWMHKALEDRFFNFDSDGCYLEDIPEAMTDPTPWNYMFLFRNLPNEGTKANIEIESCEIIDDCIARIGGIAAMMSPLYCIFGNPDYCQYIDIPNSDDKRIFTANLNFASCLGIGIMDIWQMRLADFATELAINYEYGLGPTWIPHVCRIRNTTNGTTIKTHAITIEYITYGYNPNQGYNNGGF